MGNQTQYTFSCPYCGQHLAIDGSMLTMKLECPVCKHVFTTSLSDDATTEEAIVSDSAFRRGDKGRGGDTQNYGKGKITPSEAEVASDAETTDAESQEKTPNAAFCTKMKKGFNKSMVVFVAVWRRAKEIFFRLPKRAQGAVMASVAFLVGIALLSGKSNPNPITNTLTDKSSSMATLQPLPRPDIKPLKDDEESAKWVRASCEGNWKEIMRFPEKYKGNAFYIEGKVTGIRYPDSIQKNHRGNVYVQQNNNWDEEWIVVFDDERTRLPPGNILKNDKICVFGTFEKIHKWTGTNAFNAPISGENPMLMARLISTGKYDDIVESYGNDDKEEVEEASSHPTSFAVTPNPNPTESEKMAMGRVFYVYAKQDILMSQLASAGQNDDDAAMAQFMAGLGSATILTEIDTEGCPLDFAKAWKDFATATGALKIVESGYNLMNALVRQAQLNGQYVNSEAKQKLLEMEKALPEAKKECREKMEAFASICRRYGLSNLQQWSIEAYRQYEGTSGSKLFKSRDRISP